MIVEAIFNNYRMSEEVSYQKVVVHTLKIKYMTVNNE